MAAGRYAFLARGEATLRAPSCRLLASLAAPRWVPSAFLPSRPRHTPYGSHHHITFGLGISASGIHPTRGVAQALNPFNQREVWCSRVTVLSVSLEARGWSRKGFIAESRAEGGGDKQGPGVLPPFALKPRSARLRSTRT